MDTITIDLILHLVVEAAADLEQLQRMQHSHLSHQINQLLQAEATTILDLLTTSYQREQLEALQDIQLLVVLQLDLAEFQADHRVAHLIPLQECQLDQRKEASVEHQQLDQLQEDSVEHQQLLAQLVDSVDQLQLARREDLEVATLQAQSEVELDQHNRQEFRMMMLQRETTRLFPEHLKSIIQFSQKFPRHRSTAISNSIQVSLTRLS